MLRQLSAGIPSVCKAKKKKVAICFQDEEWMHKTCSFGWDPFLPQSILVEFDIMHPRDKCSQAFLILLFAYCKHSRLTVHNMGVVNVIKTCLGVFWYLGECDRLCLFSDTAARCVKKVFREYGQYT